MRADIFCKAIDNYGDIGVCWRLARRLAHGAGWDVRLWVDDLAAFARLRPGVDTTAALQSVAGIGIVAWTPEAPALVPRDVVIEAFACDPPPAFRAAMRTSHPVWLNLEYLSAEMWIESCHGLPSPQADGLVKHFFFPGFTAATGGLLREPGLTQVRDAFQCSRGDQRDFLAGLGVPDPALSWWDRGARLVTLFCYPQAPAAALAQSLSQDERPTLLLAPEGVAPGLDTDGLVTSARQQGAALQMVRVPFMPQEQYDRLLWCGDLNFVRGEDSFVQAAWAARPLVWQIYPQNEQAHLEKLEAWLARYPAPGPASELIRAWNDPARPGRTAAALQAACAPQAWAAWMAAAAAWDREQAARPDLASQLVDFCAELSKKR